MWLMLYFLLLKNHYLLENRVYFYGVVVRQVRVPYYVRSSTYIRGDAKAWLFLKLVLHGQLFENKIYNAQDNDEVPRTLKIEKNKHIIVIFIVSRQTMTID